MRHIDRFGAATRRATSLATTFSVALGSLFAMPHPASAVEVVTWVAEGTVTSVTGDMIATGVVVGDTFRVEYTFDREFPPDFVFDGFASHELPMTVRMVIGDSIDETTALSFGLIAVTNDSTASGFAGDGFFFDASPGSSAGWPGGGSVLVGRLRDTSGNAHDFGGIPAIPPTPVDYPTERILSYADTAADQILATWDTHTPWVESEGPPAPGLGTAPNPAGLFQNVALTATVSDANTGGSNIAGIEYQLDDGDWAPMESLDDAYDSVLETGLQLVSFGTEGVHVYCARGTDEHGNVGDVSCIDIIVGAGDQIPPSVELTLDPNPVERFEDTSIRVDATDAESWVVFTEYRIDDGPWTGILAPEDGSYDSLSESGIAAESFDTIGTRLVCARATDAVNNTGEPVCERLNVGDVVPLTVTITQVGLIGTALDDGNTADLYGRVSFLSLGSGGIELSNAADALTLAAGESASPYWNFPLDVPAGTDPFTVGVGIADRDPGEVDDIADLTTDPSTLGITVDVDLRNGTWDDAPLAQECFAGGGTDAASVCIAISVRSPDADEDGDGIHDAFELFGYDHDGDGAVDVDFPALGTNVCRPDVLVELDWMKDHDPLPASVQAVVDAFAAAPQAPTAACVDDAGNTPLAGINLIVDRDDEIDTERGIDCERIGELRDEHLADAREPFFLWNGWVHDIFKKDGTTSGVACGGGGFVASLGNYEYGGDYGSEKDFGVVFGATEDQMRIEAGTLMHELGHKLRLGHGGADSINYKPNHLSVMSYTHQFFWLIQASDTSKAILDYSHGLMPSLDEDRLTETPLDAGTDRLILWANPNYDPNDDSKGRRWISGRADQGIDWNNNGNVGGPGVTVAQDLNRDGARDCVTAGGDDVLQTLLPIGVDDEIVDTDGIGSVTVGPDGICDTTAFAGDGQALPVGFDSRLLTSANEWTTMVYPAKARTFGIDAAGADFPRHWEEHLDADPTDPDFAALLTELAVLIDAEPEASVDTATQTVQYSDRIAQVTFSASDPDSGTLTGSVTGAPEDLSLTPGECESVDNQVDDDLDASICAWVLAGPVTVAPGTYPIVFTADDGTNQTTTSTEITVVAEDAEVAFSQTPSAVEVASPGGDSGPFTLAFDVTELQPDLPVDSGAAGDIALVTADDVSVTLVPVGPGSSITPSCTLGAVVDDGYAGALPVVCEFDGVPVNTYGVEVVVSGEYYEGEGEDVLTVFDPSLGFTTGGGGLIWPGTDDSTNFGFTLSYNKRGTNVRGSLLVVRHLEDGTTYRIKSNAVEGLSVGAEPGFAWAAFTTKVTYRDPTMFEAEGNHMATVYVEDRPEGDRVWMQVRDGDGRLIDEVSLAAPAPTEALAIERGNIIVPPQGPRRAE